MALMGNIMTQRRGDEQMMEGVLARKSNKVMRLRFQISETLIVSHHEIMRSNLMLPGNIEWKRITKRIVKESKLLAGN